MFEYDEAKSDATFQIRGIDFDTASEIFGDFCLFKEDKRKDYGERRYNAIGDTQGLALFVTYTWRKQDESDVIRIISARLASRDERRQYRERKQAHESEERSG